MNSIVEKFASAASPLVNLLGGSERGAAAAEARRVGFTLAMDYGEAIVMVHDRWRSNVDGIPHNSYLLAATFDPERFASADPIDRRVLLLRVIGRASIETDGEHLRAITQFFQENPDAKSGRLEGLEPLTVNRMSWSGTKCRILGTFFAGDDGQLKLGTDVEDVFATRMMRVYKPTPEALETIVNYVDPDRKAKAEEEARAAGLGSPVPFQIGTVRYTSTQHMAERGGSTTVPVRISPIDFLARRTAVFGMTRTGKSNTTKTMVSQVAITSFQTRQPIGQLIFDINGEYANANRQDEGSAINDVFPDLTVRYRITSTPGFRDLRSNFYNDLALALELIRHEVEQQGHSASSADFKAFLNIDMEKPPETEHGEMNRWKRRASIVRCILKAAGYEPDGANEASQPLSIGEHPLADIARKAIRHGILDASCFDDLDETAGDAALAEACREYFGLKVSRAPSHTASLTDLNRFWRIVRDVERASEGYKNDEVHGIESQRGTKNKPPQIWLSEEERGLLSVLVGKSSTTDTPIITGRAIGAAKSYHGPGGSEEISKDVYELLESGRIVILDLSVGSPSIRETLAEKLMREIFQRSASYFNRGEAAPKIVIYVEEAHNLIGKKAELTEIWPRIAKEGAKYGIALVYATQEPSSIHPNILANTENFFVTHLNNDNEIRALSGFYDFADFGAGLKRSQDVGFARIKTLSANFVTPTQILRFEPRAAKTLYERAKSEPGNNWFTPLQAGGR